MIDSVIKWVIPTVLGALISYTGTVFSKSRALKNGLTCLLRAEIIRSYDKYTARGEIPIYAKEALEKEYKAYHKLGGNDVATDLYNQTIKLPTK